MSEPWLIRSKLKPPQLGDALSRRADLMDLGHNVLSRRLVLLLGPPGYGKTTLMAQWQAALQKAGHITAWLSADDEDRQHAQFATYLLAAVREAANAQSQSLPVVPESLAAFKVAIGQALENAARPVTLFLDDYYRAATAENDRLLEFMLNTAPDRFRLVLASRARPDMQISSYQISGQLRQLTTRDLAFATEETAAFLGPDAARVNMSHLEARFEGWPAGLQLARIWLARSHDPGRLASQLSGRSTDLARYMAEQVLLSLEPDLQTFLLRTSILERVNGDVANAVATRTDGWAMLEAIEQQNLFLLPLDSEGQWFRYHTLFAEFLRERLRRMGEGEEAACHRRAADWFTAHGHVREALSHARRCQDMAYFVGLIERLGGWRLMLRLGTSLLHISDDFDLTLLDKSPSLALGYVYTLAQNGRITEAQQWFERLRRKTDDFHVYRGKDWDSAIYADSRTLEFVLKLYQDDNPSSDEITNAEAILHDLADPNPVADAILKNLYCYALYFESRFEECIKAGEPAAQNCRRLHLSYAENYLYPFMGSAYALQGRLDLARKAYETAHENILRDFDASHPQLQIANLYLAHLLYEQGSLAEARQLMHTAAPIVEERDGWVEVYVIAYGTHARLAFLQDGLDAAQEILDRGRHVAISRNLWRLRAEVEALEILLLARAGKTVEALDKYRDALKEGWLDPARYRERTQNWLSAHAMASAMVYGALLTGDKAAAGAALDLLDHITQQSQNRHAETVAWGLRALVHQAHGEAKDAFSAAEHMLALALRCGYRRTVMDMHPHMASLLTALLDGRKDLAADLRTFAQSLLGLSTPGPGGEEARGLSQREQEILAFIADGLSNKEIADHLHLAEGTIKTYRKRLYQKLLVSTRSQAIAKARELAIIQ